MATPPAMTDNWRSPSAADLGALRRELRQLCQLKAALDADKAKANPTPPATTSTMTLAHRPAPASSHPHPTAVAVGGKPSPTTTAARPVPLVTQTYAAYFPEGRDTFIARGGKTHWNDDDLIDDLTDHRMRVRGQQQQQRADETETQKGEIVEHYDGHADYRDGKEDHADEGDDYDYDYVLDLRHPVVASWEDSREKDDGDEDGSIIDSAFGGELDEDWEQAGGDADEAANDADDELDETDSDLDTDETGGEEEMLGGSYTLAAALALPYEVVDDDDDDSEEDEEATGGVYVLAPEYAARFKIMEVDEETEEVDWEDQSDLLAEWGSYSDYYDEYGEGERMKKKARVV